MMGEEARKNMLEQKCTVKITEVTEGWVYSCVLKRGKKIEGGVEDPI